MPPVPVEREMNHLDFSQSYLKSGLAIAVPAEGVEYRWIRVFESIFSKHTLKAIGMLVVLSLIAGIIVWSFERRRTAKCSVKGLSGESVTASGGRW